MEQKDQRAAVEQRINYEREMGAMSAKLEFLDKKIEKSESDTSLKLLNIEEQLKSQARESKEQNEKLETQFKSQTREIEKSLGELGKKLIEEIQELRHDSTFSKGVFRAVFAIGSVAISACIAMIVKLIK